MDTDQIDTVRAFNRAVSRRIGALGDRYLDRPLPLPLARLLFEIGPEGAELRGLRGRLGLDSGYLTRLLRRLQSAGLIRSVPAAADRRVRRAEWTAAGRREARALDRASDALAAGLLEPLPPGPRARLLKAMAEVTWLLRAGAVMVAVEPPGPEAEACVAAYFAELALRDARFDAARIRKLALDKLHPPLGALVMARLDGVPIGCGAVTLADGAGEIKRVWVRDDARGLGVGRRILALLEARAGALGAECVRLDTNRSLTEARALYLGAGYREVPAFNDEMFADHWFEKRLSGRR